MTRVAIIRARIEPRLKSETENILRQLGLSADEAITLFYHQVRLNRGLPFEVRLPNKTTRKTFADTDAGKNLVRVKNANELFRKLDLCAAYPVTHASLKKTSSVFANAVKI